MVVTGIGSSLFNGHFKDISWWTYPDHWQKGSDAQWNSQQPDWHVGTMCSVAMKSTSLFDVPIASCISADVRIWRVKVAQSIQHSWSF